ncbi:hypothetical protein X975_12749, partial [Stegodyphus mimosarum]
MLSPFLIIMNLQFMIENRFEGQLQNQFQILAAHFGICCLLYTNCPKCYVVLFNKCGDLRGRKKIIVTLFL